MLTRRNTKEEMLTLIDEQEQIIEKLSNRLEKRTLRDKQHQTEEDKKTIEKLRASKKTYKIAYDSQRAANKEKDAQIEFLTLENMIHMQGKVRLQNDVFERDLIIHSLMNS